MADYRSSRIVDINGVPITPASSKLPPNTQLDLLLDKDWTKNAFMINDESLDEIDIKNRYWSSADLKFTDTRFGGSIGINPKPQFCRYGDPRSPGLIPRAPVTVMNSGGNHGMGRYYSRAIDDNAERIYIRPGIPQFNSISAFLAQAFNGEQAYLAKTGRISPSYKMGQTAGGAVITAGKILAITAYPVLSLSLIAADMVGSFFTRKRSKFYSIKPTPWLYWGSVDMLLNSILVDSGMIPRSLSVLGSVGEAQQIGTNYKLDQEMMTRLHNILPDIFNSENGIDTFAAANRAMRMANYSFAQNYNRLNTGTFEGYVQKSYERGNIVDSGSVRFIDFLNKVVMPSSYFRGSDSMNGIEPDPKFDPATGTTRDPTSVKGTFFEYLSAEARQGSQFVPVIVDYTGSVSESFSNSVTESDISQKINTQASKARELEFSFANGNLTDSGIGNLIEELAGSVKDFVGGLADRTGLSALTILGGSGYLDMPKHWASSMANLPRVSYSTTLITPYNNLISRTQNIYYPMCCLLGLILPRSIGNQSYTSPFYCQVFNRGKCQIQTGMMESLQFTRGSGNIGFTNKGIMLSVDVNFNFVDMSTIVHMPLSTGELYSSSPDKVMDEDNILMDYLAVLAGQDLYSQIYAVPKAKLQVARRFHQLERMSSPAAHAMFFNEEANNGLFSSGLIGDATSIITALNSGNTIIPRL